VQQQFIIAIAIFSIVYFLIIFGRRQYGIPIWTSMLIGAALMVGFQLISIESAFKSINLDVIGFLFGMFSIVSALDKSGVVKLVSIKMLSKARNSPDLILMVFVVGMGILSAFLVNDTIALVGIPLIVYISRQIGIRPQVLLISLAFGITVGSTMTPIGNPQNLLIAIQSGIPLPFTTFIKILGIPTMGNLFVTYFILRIYFRRELVLASSSNLLPNYNYKGQESYNNNKYYRQKRKRFQSPTYPSFDDQSITEGQGDQKITAEIVNPRLARISIIILLLLIVGFVISEFVQFIFHIGNNFSLSIIAMLGATVLYALSNERREILAGVDYSILVFFAAMFVFIAGLWSSGIISVIISHFPTPDRNDIFQSNAMISAISITLSQVLSNVPFISLYNLVMINNGFTGSTHTNQWMMLAAASTIAGNLTIFAAASNIIIIEAAESRGLNTFTFFEFFKIGSIVTMANIAIYYLFIVLVFA
jgi:Na+/H+ antiporter NhaD/arsenite permease-like protein